MAGPKLLVGITMRVAHAPVSGEPRDALAQDWSRFFSVLLPGRPWLMLPNTGESCPDLAQSMGVNALVLSGGDDIGASPLRDATETALLRWAASHNLPVLGVCRGLQMLQHYFGGGLVRLAPERHVRTRHAVDWPEHVNVEMLYRSARRYAPQRAVDSGKNNIFSQNASFEMATFQSESALDRGNGLERREVNSYHQYGIPPDQLAPELKVLACCPEDGSVEAARARGLPWLGIMWHPEREAVPHSEDLDIFRRHFHIASRA